jgi:hypothetical protein
VINTNGLTMTPVFSPCITPEQHGALGNYNIATMAFGADDTASIQAAILDAAAQGIPCVFTRPYGISQINQFSPIFVPPGAHLIFTGAGALCSNSPPVLAWLYTQNSHGCRIDNPTFYYGGTIDPSQSPANEYATAYGQFYDTILARPGSQHPNPGNAAALSMPMLNSVLLICGGKRQRVSNARFIALTNTGAASDALHFFLGACAVIDGNDGTQPQVTFGGETYLDGVGMGFVTTNIDEVTIERLISRRFGVLDTHLAAQPNWMPPEHLVYASCNSAANGSGAEMQAGILNILWLDDQGVDFSIAKNRPVVSVKSHGPLRTYIRGRSLRAYGALDGHCPDWDIDISSETNFAMNAAGGMAPVRFLPDTLNGGRYTMRMKIAGQINNVLVAFNNVNNLDLDLNVQCDGVGAGYTPLLVGQISNSRITARLVSTVPVTVGTTALRVDQGGSNNAAQIGLQNFAFGLVQAVEQANTPAASGNRVCLIELGKQTAQALTISTTLNA